MDIKCVLEEYDSLFGNTTLTEIESYLYQKICEAVREQDDAAVITLINEMIGLCRDTSQKEKETGVVYSVFPVFISLQWKNLNLQN